MENQQHPEKWKTLLAFATIYFVWGSTYLAIRIGVREVPPFLFAAIRFTIAGSLVCLWSLARREPFPNRRQWMSVFLLALLIFVLDYGLLFWAEQRVPSGIAAVMLATIPAFTALSEILILRSRMLTVRLAAALGIGILGVAVLISPAASLGGLPISRAGATALIIASVSWSIASVLMRRLPLPQSRIVNSGAQMLAGGILLTLTSVALGEYHGFRPQAISHDVLLSLLYLIFVGSIIAFTTWVWLIQRVSPTKVGTYAYVNPVVAVLLGYFFAGEPLGARTILGMALILTSILVIATTRPART